MGEKQLVVKAAEPKPGKKSTELYAMLLAQVLGILSTIGVLTPDHVHQAVAGIDQIIGGVLMVVPVVLYIFGRSKVKAEYAKKLGVLFLIPVVALFLGFQGCGSVQTAAHISHNSIVTTEVSLNGAYAEFYRAYIDPNDSIDIPESVFQNGKKVAQTVKNASWEASNAWEIYLKNKDNEDIEQTTLIALNEMIAALQRFMNYIRDWIDVEGYVVPKTLTIKNLRSP